MHRNRTRAASRSASPASPTTKAETPRDAASAPTNGLLGLLALVESARRYHAEHPLSKRKPEKRALAAFGESTDASSANTSTQSSVASADTSLGASRSGSSWSGAMEPWEYLSTHVEHFWVDDDADVSCRYARGKQWLTSLRLWDPQLTWKQVELTAPEQSPTVTAERKRQLLRKIPKGQLFL